MVLICPLPVFRLIYMYYSNFTLIRTEAPVIRILFEF